MRHSCTLLVPLLLALGCAQLGTHEELIPPEVDVINLVPLGLSGFEQRMRLDLRVRNPNNYELACDGLRFDLTVNGEPFASGVSDHELTLPRLGEERISVEASTTVFGLLRQIGALASSQELGFDYEIAGRLFLTEPWRRGIDFQRGGRLGR